MVWHGMFYNPASWPPPFWLYQSPTILHLFPASFSLCCWLPSLQLMLLHPHFINSFSMRLSAGIFSSIHWWLILSKQLFMSPSNIHCGESFLLSTLNAYSLASSGLLYLRNPNDILSAVVSATGSNARSCSACIYRKRPAVPNQSRWFYCHGIR